MRTNWGDQFGLVDTLKPERLQHSHQLGHVGEHEVPTVAFLIFPKPLAHVLGQLHVNHRIPLDETPKFAALQIAFHPP